MRQKNKKVFVSEQIYDVKMRFKIPIYDIKIMKRIV